MEERYQSAIAQVYVHEPTFDRTEVAERLDIGIPVAELNTRRGWRRDLRKVLERDGRKVVAINVLAVPKDGVSVVITVKSGAAPRRGKPVLRGGKPIDGPQKVRTVAARQRAR